VTSLGLDLWVESEENAASVATLVRPPVGSSVSALVDASSSYLGDRERGLLSPAPGPLADLALRINHTGLAAQPGAVVVAITALAAGLGELGIAHDLEAALASLDGALFPV